MIRCWKTAADGIETAALIVHGGTIMSIMEAYARPKALIMIFKWEMERDMNWLLQMTVPVLAGFVLDLLLGDPAWLYHPVRLIGLLIEKGEKLSENVCQRPEAVSAWAECPGGFRSDYKRARSSGDPFGRRTAFLSPWDF